MRASSLAIVCLFAVRAAAAPPDPRAHDDDDEDDPADRGFSWAKAAHPSRIRFGELVARATELQQAGAPAPAITLLQQAVAVDASEPYGHYRLGIALRDLRRFGECADSLTTVIRLRADYLPPDAPGVRSVERAAGDCLAQAGRFDEAIELYRAALPKEDIAASGDIHWAIGQAFEALGRLDEAIEEDSAAVALRPQEPVFRFALAVALDRDEQVTRARDEMAQGLRLDRGLARLSDRWVAGVLGGHVYYAVGLGHQIAADTEPLRRALAIVFYRKFIDLDPDGVWRKRAREHLAELGAPSVAATDIEIHPDPPPMERQALQKVIAGRSNDLTRCLEGSPLAALRGAFVLEPVAGKKKERADTKKPSTLQVFLTPEPRQPIVTSVGPEPAPTLARQCVEAALRGVRSPMSQLTRVTVLVVSAR